MPNCILCKQHYFVNPYNKSKYCEDCVDTNPCTQHKNEDASLDRLLKEESDSVPDILNLINPTGKTRVHLEE